jgi:hypothetical protein
MGLALYLSLGSPSQDSGTTMKAAPLPPTPSDESEEGFEIVRVADRGGVGGRGAAFIATR